jgi:antitoxin component YwqK of YwqJK toxin-antitoxin module
MLRQTRYTDGLKDEKESIFDKDGKLVKEIIYLNGKPDIALFYKNNDVVDVQENF